MNKAKITFANGDSIVLSEGVALYPIHANTKSNEKFASKDECSVLSYHISEGLIPSILDVLCFCEFFEYDDIVYNTKTIVSIKNI
jgi:hypothetical protein